MPAYQNELKQWQEQAKAIDARVEALQNSIHDRGWKLAQSVGIGRCGCSLHNAAIDDGMTGWCFKNPKRLKLAKLANALVNDWSISDLGSRITARLYNKIVARPNGWCEGIVRPIDRKPNIPLLFKNY